MSLEGILYIGYPILATADEKVTVDALLVTLQYGLVAFLFDDHSPVENSREVSWEHREDGQNRLFIAAENSLKRHETLRKRAQTRDRRSDHYGDPHRY